MTAYAGITGPPRSGETPVISTGGDGPAVSAEGRRVKPGDDEEVNAMQKWNMIIDVAECTNCNLCTLAVMDEYVGNAWPGYSAPMPKHGHKWIDIRQKERGQVPMIDIAYVPTMCNHCDHAPCMAKAGDAVKKREDGIILIDPEKARGRKDLVEACPYGHIWWNEELQLPQIWPFDAHLLDQGWQQTRGQQSCPTGAMRAIKLEDEDMARLAREQNLEVMKPELGTRPRVYYRNLWRYSKCFIGGTLSTEKNGMVDCVEGARVRLIKDGRTVAETTSDNYGDFKFDKLDEGSGVYRIEILASGSGAASLEAVLGASINLGEIRL
jgi:Fe-S-cluster-containing dehydrogenase component